MHRRIQITTDPLLDKTQYRFGDTLWPARWVGPQSYAPDESAALVFRRAFQMPKAKKTRIHISADQRYELYVDGEYVGRGAERSDLRNWVYETYELDLKAGNHSVVVKLWWLSPSAPAAEAQQTHAPGLLLFAEGDANELLSTGVAQWEYRDLPGYSFKDHDRLRSYFATGAQLQIDGRKVCAEVEAGAGTGWQEVRTLGTVALAALRWESRPWWILRPAYLPAMYEKRIRVGKARHVEAVASEKTTAVAVKADANLTAEQSQWNALLKKGQSLTIPANTLRRVIIDLDNYYCVFPQLRCCGLGAYVRMQTAESLFSAPEGNSAKGNRDQIEGKYFLGVGIEITAGADGFVYRPHAFMAGRYMEILVKTGENPLKIDSLTLDETHFPFDFTAQFASDDPAHEQIIPIALRTIEMCSHDTSMDCPYYERLNYVGDTRLQTLIAYVSAGEERLGRKCMEMFDISRQPSGLTSSRYPTRTTQTIPPFSLWWVGMIHDFAMWRNDKQFVADRMLGVRGVLESWRKQLDTNGLLRSPAGWNFVDWVPAWRGGIPAGGNDGFSSILNMQAIYTLKLAAELEELMGEPLLAKRHRQFAAELAAAVKKAYFDAKAGLFADDLEHTLYSEHAQCVAILSGVVWGPAAGKLADRMIATQGLSQATIYFAHYLFETLGKTGRMDALLKRLEMWKQLPANGFRTAFEMPEPSRSDCHAWGAHPVYHMLATIAGIRPAGFGFDAVTIRPQLGSLKHIEGRMPHRQGFIEFSLDSDGKGLTGKVTVPAGLPAVLEYAGKKQALRAGVNTVKVK